VRSIFSTKNSEPLSTFHFARR